MDGKYGALDRPQVLSCIFHPRAEVGMGPSDDTVSNHLIAVDDGIHIGARFHCSSLSGANLLFFHGNGEIVADYDDLGPLFGKMGINLLVVDYRGYGRSNGSPTVTAMMTDCHRIYDYVQEWLKHNNHSGPLIIMGRSLGSASALELAAEHKDLVQGLIIESGFAYATPLLRLLGVDPETLGFNEGDDFENLDKIAQYRGLTLIIHAEFDHIIPFTDGLALYKASAAHDKRLLKIDGANHNDIMMRGFDSYMQAIERMASRLIDQRQNGSNAHPAA